MANIKIFEKFRPTSNQKTMLEFCSLADRLIALQKKEEWNTNSTKNKKINGK